MPTPRRAGGGRRGRWRLAHLGRAPTLAAWPPARRPAALLAGRTATCPAWHGPRSCRAAYVRPGCGSQGDRHRLGTGTGPPPCRAAPRRTTTPGPCRHRHGAHAVVELTPTCPLRRRPGHRLEQIDQAVTIPAGNDAAARLEIARAPSAPRLPGHAAPAANRPTPVRRFVRYCRPPGTRSRRPRRAVDRPPAPARLGLHALGLPAPTPGRPPRPALDAVRATAPVVACWAAYCRGDCRQPQTGGHRDDPSRRQPRPRRHPPRPGPRLVALAAALDPREFAVTLTTRPGRRPCLSVTSRHAAIGDDITADHCAYYWSWGERIAPVHDPADRRPQDQHRTAGGARARPWLTPASRRAPGPTRSSLSAPAAGELCSSLEHRRAGRPRPGRRDPRADGHRRAAPPGGVAAVLGPVLPHVRAVLGRHPPGRPGPPPRPGHHRHHPRTGRVTSTRAAGRRAPAPLAARARRPDQGCKARVKASATCPAHACPMGPGSGPARCRATSHPGKAVTRQGSQAKAPAPGRGGWFFTHLRRGGTLRGRPAGSYRAAGACPPRRASVAGPAPRHAAGHRPNNHPPLTSAPMTAPGPRTDTGQKQQIMAPCCYFRRQLPRGR